MAGAGVARRGQRRGDRLRECQHGFACGRRVEPQPGILAPVVALALGDLGGDGILVALVRLLQLRRIDQVDRQDQVVAAERLLAADEQLDLLAAVGTAEEQRTEHRQEEAGLADHLRELLLPLLAEHDAFDVLPQPEVAVAGDHLNSGLQRLAERGDVAAEELIVLAGIAQEPQSLGHARAP